MMRASSILRLLTAATFVAACGKKPAPEQPAPEPTPAPTAERTPPPPPPAKTDDADAKARAAAEAARALKNDLIAIINFDFDKADIRQADQANLDRKAAILAANSSVKVRISGHADERGSDEYNLALGNRRGAAAKRYLAGKGIDDSRMDVVSFGEERPRNTGHDEAAWAENRRDEFELLSAPAELMAPTAR
jgi:peptidoglycan-associated lipoprotein